MIWLLPVAVGAGVLWWLDRQRRAPAEAQYVRTLSPSEMSAMFPSVAFPAPPYAGDLPAVGQLGALVAPEVSPYPQLPPSYAPMSMPTYAPYVPEQQPSFAPYGMQPQDVMPVDYGMPMGAMPFDPSMYMGTPTYTPTPPSAFDPSTYMPPAIDPNMYPPMDPGPYMDPSGMQTAPGTPPTPIATLYCADRCPIRPEPRPWNDQTMGPFGFTAPRGHPVSVLSYGPVGWAHVLVQHPDDPSPVEGWVETRFLTNSPTPQPAPAPQPQPTASAQGPTDQSSVAHQLMNDYIAQRTRRRQAGMSAPATGGVSSRFARPMPATPVQGRQTPRMKRQQRMAAKKAQASRR